MASALLALAAYGCNVRAPRSPDGGLALGSSEWISPPAKPGDSLEHAKSCRCLMCRRAGCCQREEPERYSGGTCAQGLDFSACDDQVQSCEGNCRKLAWSVRDTEPCASQAKDDCCPDSVEDGS